MRGSDGFFDRTRRRFSCGLSAETALKRLRIYALSARLRGDVHFGMLRGNVLFELLRVKLVFSVLSAKALFMRRNRAVGFVEHRRTDSFSIARRLALPMYLSSLVQIALRLSG